MSELFDEDREDPRILVRFDQIDAKLSEHGRRFDQIDERFDQVLETLDVKLDAMRFETLAAFRGEIQTTINGQWRTVLIGMTTLALLLVATSLALGQIL